MRFAVDIWEAARSGDVGRLEQVIFWEQDGSGVRMLSHPELPPGQLPQPPALVERAWIAGAHLGDNVLDSFVEGDLVKPALHYVQSVINKQLQGRASPGLLWDTDRERLGLYIIPDSLIGALWLQLARAVERDSQFRRCAECGIWFELAPGTARSDKLYCSTPCRTKAYRRRQADAARLHDEGRSIEDIAHDLVSDPETVRGWIERKAGSGTSPQARASSGGGRRVGAQIDGRYHDLDRYLAGANALAPDLMDPAARLDEIGEILAIALLRLRRQQSSEPWLSEKNSLDFPAGRSVHATTGSGESHTMSESVLAQIAALKDKTTPQLRALWKELFDREAPPLGRRYLEDRLAFRLQELQLGVLVRPRPPQARRAVDQVDPKAARRREPQRLLPGTQLRRSGKASSMWSRCASTISSSGRPYKSLSAIARAITNVRWNGRCFSVCAQAVRTDERASSQGTGGDLLPQELRGRTWPIVQLIARAA